MSEKDSDYQGKIIVYGIELTSRYEKLYELKEMIAFAEIAYDTGVAKYIKEVFYDTKACVASFTFHCGEINCHDPIYDRVLFAASHSLSQFELDGCVYNDDMYCESEYKITEGSERLIMQGGSLIPQ